jgi:hypothetical protein
MNELIGTPRKSASALPIAELKATFERDGFLSFPTTIPHSLLDRARADVEPVLLKKPRIQDAWKQSEAIRRIATWPDILDMLAEFYGKKPLPFQTLNFRMGTEQDIHSDTVHFNSMPHGFMCGVWVALEDIDEENGPLIYYPGSQTWPEVTLKEVEEAGYFKRNWWDEALTLGNRLGIPPHQQGPHYRAYELYLADLVGRSGVEPRLGVVKKGDAILWAANLLHGGSQQNDKTRTRWSQVSHYFFQGDRYYTPLHSHGSFVWYRNPNFIPLD